MGLNSHLIIFPQNINTLYKQEMFNNICMLT